MATEKRMIDVTDYNIKAILEKVPYYPDEIWKFTAMTKRFPTVDAVEVVRCKDCKHYQQSHTRENIGLCEYWDTEVKSNEFCSRAKIQESEVNQ